MFPNNREYYFAENVMSEFRSTILLQSFAHTNLNVNYESILFYLLKFGTIWIRCIEFGNFDFWGKFDWKLKANSQHCKSNHHSCMKQMIYLNLS